MVIFSYRNMISKLKHAPDYIFGHVFYFLCTYFPILLTKNLRNKFKQRIEACPNCFNSSELECCGCKSPQAFFKLSECKLGKFDKLFKSIGK
jgi:hypothetical protein